MTVTRKLNAQTSTYGAVASISQTASARNRAIRSLRKAEIIIETLSAIINAVKRSVGAQALKPTFKH